MIMKTTAKTGKYQKIQKKFEKKVSKSLNHIFFSENFTQDPLEVFIKLIRMPIRT